MSYSPFPLILGGGGYFTGVSDEFLRRKGRSLKSWTITNPLKDLPTQYFSRQKAKNIKEMIGL
jgi:hypothetical protein